jgi:hypothetical protein
MINEGEKIADYCKTRSCTHYNTIVALSNHAGLKNNIICPKTFCDWVWFKTEEKQEKKIEKECPGKGIENINEQLILDKVINEFKNTKLDLNIYIDRDEKNKKFLFFNPMNSSPTPLVWEYDYVKIAKFEQLVKEIEDFFKTFLDQFRELSCESCPDAPTNLMGMNCVDCSRNKDSKAFLKKDRYRGSK